MGLILDKLGMTEFMLAVYGSLLVRYPREDTVAALSATAYHGEVRTRVPSASPASTDRRQTAVLTH